MSILKHILYLILFFIEVCTFLCMVVYALNISVANILHCRIFLNIQSGQQSALSST